MAGAVLRRQTLAVRRDDRVQERPVFRAGVLGRDRRLFALPVDGDRAGFGRPEPPVAAPRRRPPVPPLLRRPCFGCNRRREQLERPIRMPTWPELSCPISSPEREGLWWMQAGILSSRHELAPRKRLPDRWIGAAIAVRAWEPGWRVPRHPRTIRAPVIGRADGTRASRPHPARSAGLWNGPGDLAGPVLDGLATLQLSYSPENHCPPPPREETDSPSGVRPLHVLLPRVRGCLVALAVSRVRDDDLRLHCGPHGVHGGPGPRFILLRENRR